MDFIPYGRQDIQTEDIEAVVSVLSSDWLTQGPAVGRFESVLAEYCGARHAVAVSSGTAALHLACHGLGLGPGDWLWTSPNSFAASANCAVYCGAQVDFVDIEPRTLERGSLPTGREISPELINDDNTRRVAELDTRPLPILARIASRGEAS